MLRTTIIRLSSISSLSKYNKNISTILLLPVQKCYFTKDHRSIKKENKEKIQNSTTATEFSIDGISDKMNVSYKHYLNEMNLFRLGRVMPNMLDNLMVEIDGENYPLDAVASVASRGTNMLLINYVSAIIKNFKNDFPTYSIIDEDQTIKFVSPKVTEELRKTMLKSVKAKAEEHKVSIRNIRQEFMQELRAASKGMGKDEAQRYEKQIQKFTDDFTKNINDTLVKKEKEIQTEN